MGWFFILGFAIILQARQFSRLNLARSLRWLAAFGILHGFNEWGDLFIPIQATFLDPVAIKIFYVVQLLLLAAAIEVARQLGAL